MTLSQSARLHLPRDIIIDILYRLPFELILECKLVSKEWKNIINDPKFFLFFLKNPHPQIYVSFFLDDNSLYCLIIKRNSKHTTFGYLPYVVHQIPVELETYSPFDHQLLNSGSSDGIACVKTFNGHFFLYNLFTGDSCVVQRTDLRQSYGPYGFGYDTCGDEYKILIKYNNDVSLFWIYSFRDQSWTSFKGFPIDYDWVDNHSLGGYFFNDVFYWLVVTKQTRKEVILTFDLHTIKFGEISVPLLTDYDGEKRDYGKSLAELDGHLCYVCVMMFKVHVWVMEEASGRVSWKVLASLSYCSSLSCGTSMDLLAPMMLFECEDGEKVVLFVGRYNPRLNLYDVRLISYGIQENSVEVIQEMNWRKMNMKQLKIKKSTSNLLVQNV